MTGHVPAPRTRGSAPRGRWLVVADSDFRQRIDGGQEENFRTMEHLQHVADIAGLVYYGHGASPEHTVDLPNLRLPRRGAWTAAHPSEPFVSASRPVPQDVLAPFVGSLLPLDGVFLTSFKAWRVAQLVATKCALPVVMRGHNIEEDYYRAVARKTTGPKKALLSWEAAKVGRLEREILSASWLSAIADLSEDDHVTRREVCGTKARYLPSSALTHAASIIDDFTPEPPHYPRTVAFLGSWTNPTNSEAAHWFVQEVWPHVRSKVPDATFHIMGRAMDDQTKTRLCAVPGVEVIGDVEHPIEELSKRAVCVNPMLSGSGVNIKMADYLCAKRPLVTTPLGARGLDSSVTEHIFTAEGAHTFAHYVSTCLTNHEQATALRAAEATSKVYQLHTATAQLAEILDTARAYQT